MPSSRPRRNQPPRESPISATISRSSSGSPTDNKKSLRLTVKAPASKLRQATSRSASAQQQDELPRNARSSRPKKPIVDESEMDDDEDDDLEDDDEEEEEEEDAEGEEDDDEMDVDGEADSDDDPVSRAPGPARPIISRVGTASHPKVTVTPAPTSSRPVPVESKEMALANQQKAISPSATATSDEELSELEDEDAEGEEEDDEDEDGEGEEEDEEEDAEGEEDEEDDDAAMPAGSDDEDTGQGTPDVSKMTKRQRERFAGNNDGAFMQLSMEPQIKKHLTAEESAMRRAEMARRRKNLSEKRNEEEKRDTINRLLKKQAPKRRGKVSRQEEAEVEGDQEEDPEERPSRMFTRSVNSRAGFVLGVPLEWEGKAVTGVLGNGAPSPWLGPKVQVVEES